MSLLFDGRHHALTGKYRWFTGKGGAPSNGAPDKLTNGISHRQPVAAAFANTVAVGFLATAAVALWSGVNPLWVGLGATATAWTIVTGLAEMSLATTRRLNQRNPPVRWPDVLALMPVYQEPVQYLSAALSSLLGQDYPGTIRIVIVDDGSYRDEKTNEFPDQAAKDKWAQLNAIYQECEAKYGITVLRNTVNRGKRFAQDTAMTEIGWDGFDLWFPTDSDTMLEQGTVLRMVRRFVADPEVGVVSARITARSPSNLVEKLAAQQLILREARRRPAESALRQGASPGGPVMMMSRDVAFALWRGYQTKTFRGVTLTRRQFKISHLGFTWALHLPWLSLPNHPVTAGEDMYLTAMTLIAWGRRGPRSVFAEDAIAITDVPSTWAGLRKQYLRWTRDEARPNLRLLGQMLAQLGRTGRSDFAQLSFFTRANLVLRWLAPIFLALNIIIVSGFILTGHPEALLVPVLAFALDAATLTRHREWKALFLLPVYFAAQLLLLPTRLHALATPSNSSWLTRVAPTAGQDGQDAIRTTVPTGEEHIRHNPIRKHHARRLDQKRERPARSQQRNDRLHSQQVTIATGSTPHQKAIPNLHNQDEHCLANYSTQSPLVQ